MAGGLCSARSFTVKPQDYGQGLRLGQRRFVVILATETVLWETAGCCFCCRRLCLPCVWISTGTSDNTCTATRQQHSVPLPAPDTAGRKSPRQPRKIQPQQRSEACSPKGGSAGRTRLQTKAALRQGGSLCPRSDI